MGFGFAGAGAGASKALEEILAEQMVRAQLEQRQKEAAERQALDVRQFEAGEKERESDRQFRQSQIELGERKRRDDNNDRGLDLMKADKAQMDTDAIMGSLPPQLKQFVDLRRVGVTGISPQDLQSPEDRAAADQAKKAAEFEDWKKKQDYDEGQIRSRPKEPKASGPGGLSTAQGNTALKFQDDYARDSKPYLTVRDAYQRLKSSSAKPDAAGDLSMIFAYMKMLDPNSVVREQEFANAQNAAGVPDRIRNAYNNAMKGTRLTPEQRAQFVAQAEGIFDSAKKNQQKVRQTYGSRAKQWEIPESMVLDADDEPQPAPGAPIQKEIPGIPGAVAESKDGGKTWVRVK